MEKYDVIIVGAGPCGIYSAYELIKSKRNLKRNKEFNIWMIPLLI